MLPWSLFCHFTVIFLLTHEAKSRDFTEVWIVKHGLVGKSGMY